MSRELSTLCVINWNGERYLGETLNAAVAIREQFHEIVLVDNASTDGSVQRVRTGFPEVRIVELPQNRGPAVARNAGFRAARSDLILFLDNDVVLDEECVPRLREALAEQPNAAIAMPRVLYADHPGTIQYDGAHAHFLGLMTLESADTPVSRAPRQTRPLGSVITACFLFHRGRWGSEPPFDESFLFNYEDHDFGMRTRVLGHEILAVPGAVCLHRGGTAGLSMRSGREYAPMRVYCLIRNRWQIVAKCYRGRTLLLLSPVFALYEAAQLAGTLKKGWGREWLQAVVWMARNAPEIRRKRRKVQQTRRRPDRELLRGGPIPFRRELVSSGLELAAERVLSRLAGGYWSRVQGLVG